jgi:hypothetical protein
MLSLRRNSSISFTSCEKKNVETEDDVTHNPFKSDMSRWIIMLELCSTQPQMTSLALIKLRKSSLVLVIFQNFTSFHEFTTKTKEMCMPLDLQALLEWDEKDRMNRLSFKFVLILPCWLSSFSLPLSLFILRERKK